MKEPLLTKVKRALGIQYIPDSQLSIGSLSVTGDSMSGTLYYFAVDVCSFIFDISKEDGHLFYIVNRNHYIFVKEIDEMLGASHDLE